MKFKKNQIVGDFQIIEYLGKSTWLCQCIDCRIQRTYKTNNLSMPKAGQCQCKKSGVKKGDIFNRLTVIERDVSKPKGSIVWKCKCKCGNYISVSTKCLKNNNTKSCGCLMLEKSMKQIKQLHENLEDLTGKRFCKLTVIEQAFPNNRPKGIRYWKCKCDCNNYHIAGTSELKREKVKSCGCLKSKGEKIIKDILRENKIDYATQVTFNDCLSKNGVSYRFDFGIVNNNREIKYLIEYDGIQHFDSKRQFGNDEDSFKNIQIRDKEKNDYCLVNNIPLIRIPYYIEKIKLEDLLLNETNFLLKGDDEV